MRADLQKYLRKRPRTMAELIRRYGNAPVVETMREISNTTDEPVLCARVWSGGWYCTYWIAPSRYGARWKRWFAEHDTEPGRAEVV